MPRGAKSARRQKVNAGIEYRKGKRKEAYTLWEKAAAARKERFKAKRNKHNKAEEGAPAEAASQV